MFWKKKKKPTKPCRDDILQQAKESLADKRAEIGDEALDQIRSAIMSRENSALQNAKKIILNTDKDKVRDNLNLWLRE